jgi:amino acid transporter
VLCLGLNAIVGSGIFLLPDDLYREMGALSPLAFLLCGLGLIPVALCYAVAARHHDQNGGPYLYARESFGSLTAFVVGFMAYATGVLSFSAVAAAAAASCGSLIPALGSPGGLWGTAALAVLIFSALNYIGARPGASTVNVFTLAKFVILGVVLVLLAPSVGSVAPSMSLPHGASGVGAAVFMAVFAAQGFEVVGVPAGESRDPERDIPRAIVSSLGAATLLYVVVQAAVVWSYAGLGQESDTPLADAASRVDPRLGGLVAFGAVISTWGFVAGTALGTPRYLFALARGGDLPAIFGRVHSRYGSPGAAIVVTAALALFFVTFFDYRSLIGMSNVTIAVQYLTTCLAVGKLARLNERSSYSLPGKLTIPALGGLMSLWIFSEASREELVWVCGTLLVGGLVSWISRRSAVPTS